MTVSIHYYHLMQITQVLIVSVLVVGSAAISLLKSAAPCPQILTLTHIHLVDPEQLLLHCGSDVDREEPAQIYNMTSNKLIILSKDKSELVSVVEYHSDAGLVVLGDSNSTVSIYDHDGTHYRVLGKFNSGQNNVKVLAAQLWARRKLVLWVGSDGKLCVGSMLKNRTSCVLAHSFNATAIHVSMEMEMVITCGGDRICRSWRIEGPEESAIGLKSYLLSKMSHVQFILASARRIIVGGADGYEQISLVTPPQFIAQPTISAPVLCALLLEQWDSMLAITPDGSLLIIGLTTGSITRSPFTEKVASCSFHNMTIVVTGHGHGVARVWQI